LESLGNGNFAIALRLRSQRSRARPAIPGILGIIRAALGTSHGALLFSALLPGRISTKNRSVNWGFDLSRPSEL
jgi:hypothetical protein